MEKVVSSTLRNVGDPDGLSPVGAQPRSPDCEGATLPAVPHSLRDLSESGPEIQDPITWIPLSSQVRSLMFSGTTSPSLLPPSDGG